MLFVICAASPSSCPRTAAAILRILRRASFSVSVLDPSYGAGRRDTAAHRISTSACHTVMAASSSGGSSMPNGQEGKLKSLLAAFTPPPKQQLVVQLSAYAAYQLLAGTSVAGMTMLGVAAVAASVLFGDSIAVSSVDRQVDMLVEAARLSYPDQRPPVVVTAEQHIKCIYETVHANIQAKKIGAAVILWYVLATAQQAITLPAEEMPMLSALTEFAANLPMILFGTLLVVSYYNARTARLLFYRAIYRLRLENAKLRAQERSTGQPPSSA